jgi:riboflavin synthase
VFTGIITEIGRVASLTKSPDGMTARIESQYPEETIETGCSICCSGCCLTVTDFGALDAGSWFDIDISNESLALTTLGAWQEGSPVNLERAVSLSMELGGHLVTGHVDGLGKIVSLEKDGDSVRFEIDAPVDLAGFIARKGSVTLDGVSLTVNGVEGTRFSINVIPHTLEATIWGKTRVGDQVNLEVDLIARYVARLYEYQAETAGS